MAGMFRKDNKLIRAWEQSGPPVYSAIQKSIILHGADMLRPGGMMLYSTCTFSKLEDEESIRHLLDNRPDMHPWRRSYYLKVSRNEDRK